MLKDYSCSHSSPERNNAAGRGYHSAEGLFMLQFSSHDISPLPPALPPAPYIEEVVVDDPASRALMRQGVEPYARLGPAEWVQDTEECTTRRGREQKRLI